MGKLIDPVVVSGLIRGSCPKCQGGFEGQFDSDPDVELTCEKCGHVGRYLYHWPDELPRPYLRHRRNKHLLESSFRAPRNQRKRKAKKSDPLVLPGQLSLEKHFMASQYSGLVGSEDC